MAYLGRTNEDVQRERMAADPAWAARLRAQQALNQQGTLAQVATRMPWMQPQQPAPSLQQIINSRQVPNPGAAPQVPPGYIGTRG